MIAYLVSLWLLLLQFLFIMNVLHELCCIYEVEQDLACKYTRFGSAFFVAKAGGVSVWARTKSSCRSLDYARDEVGSSQ